jgi:hypothetical protein
MHAEVFVRFKDEIRAERLVASLPPGSNPADVLKATSLRDRQEVLTAAVYARSEPTFAYIILATDPRSLRVHVHGEPERGGLGELVRQAELLAEALIDLGRSRGAQLASASITLHATNFFITTGRRWSVGERLMKRFVDTIFGDVVVGLFTGVLTGLLTRQWDAATVVGLASVLCLLAWIAIEIGGEADAYHYDHP